MTQTSTDNLALVRARDSNLEDRAHQAIVDWLTSEHPQPGQIVPVREFARRLGMSRTPVRSAVGRLHERGLLSYDPAIGFTVAAPSLSSLYEMFELRLMIESHAMRRYTEQAPHVPAPELRRLLDEAAELAEGAVDDPAKYMAFRDNDTQFHRAMVDLAGLPRLLAMHDELHLSIHVTRAGMEAQLTHQRLDTAVSEHRAIVEALEANDAAGAREALESHILRVRDQTIVFMAQPRPSGVARPLLDGRGR
ncbi:GntR family transcriptional regulator [Desertihabitans aurantiacus]|uniref:GntR family transcriptional regulator n=1 Tax=Desertihabitans aurantiacus TaxID=2282477 RepID=UPI0018E56965|nr:GntR family transcriptional regulator [Desertihabitans aurantiacus]